MDRLPSIFKARARASSNEMRLALYPGVSALAIFDEMISCLICRKFKEVANAFNKDAFIPPTLKLTISIGMAMTPKDSNNKDDLVRKADLALYNAKKSGKNKTCVYSPELEEL